MNTLLGHFQHYYKNLGVMSHFLYFFENKENKIRQAIYFGMLHAKIMAMPLPTIFVNLHSQISLYTELPTEQQKYIGELDSLLEKAKEFILGPPQGRYEPDDLPYRKYEKLLENGEQKEIEVFLETLETLLLAFYNRLAGLGKFKESYP